MREEIHLFQQYDNDDIYNIYFVLVCGEVVR